MVDGVGASAGVVVVAMDTDFVVAAATEAGVTAAMCTTQTSTTPITRLPTSSRAQFYKTFYGRNLRIFVKS
jgi:hypothetical protein